MTRKGAQLLSVTVWRKEEEKKQSKKDRERVSAGLRGSRDAPRARSGARCSRERERISCRSSLLLEWMYVTCGTPAAVLELNQIKLINWEGRGPLHAPLRASYAPSWRRSRIASCSTPWLKKKSGAFLALHSWLALVRPQQRAPGGIAPMVQSRWLRGASRCAGSWTRLIRLRMNIQCCSTGSSPNVRARKGRHTW